jgi:hypothetical protein
MTLLIVFLPNIEMKNKLNHAVEIFNRYFPPDPGVINSPPASTPGLLKQASPASGGHKVVALRGLLPFMLSMSKHPLAFRL